MTPNPQLGNFGSNPNAGIGLPIPTLNTFHMFIYLMKNYASARRNEFRIFVPNVAGGIGSYINQHGFIVHYQDGIFYTSKRNCLRILKKKYKKVMLVKTLPDSFKYKCFYNMLIYLIPNEHTRNIYRMYVAGDFYYIDKDGTSVFFDLCDPFHTSKRNCLRILKKRFKQVVFQRTTDNNEYVYKCE